MGQTNKVRLSANKKTILRGNRTILKLLLDLDPIFMRLKGNTLEDFQLSFFLIFLIWLGDKIL